MTVLRISTTNPLLKKQLLKNFRLIIFYQYKEVTHEKIEVYSLIHKVLGTETDAVIMKKYCPKTRCLRSQQ
jgi:ribosomal protein S24E